MGFDLGLFRVLSAVDGSWTVSDLSRKTGVDELLMSTYKFTHSIREDRTYTCSHSTA